MQKLLFEGNGITSLGSVDGEEDLKPKGGININPSPSDGRCDCCGRHLSELRPFGKAGDPLVGDFDGFLLLKTHRSNWPFIFEEAEKIYWMMMTTLQKCVVLAEILHMKWKPVLNLCTKNANKSTLPYARKSRRTEQRRERQGLPPRAMIEKGWIN
jgi:hypothetical protein